MYAISSFRRCCWVVAGACSFNLQLNQPPAVLAAKIAALGPGWEGGRAASPSAEVRVFVVVGFFLSFGERS